MKQLYTFFWIEDGKKEEPLQATSERQALWHLINRKKRQNPNFNKFIILNSFRDGTLRYKIGTPYQQIPKQKPAPKPPEQLELDLPSFSDYIRRKH